MARRVRKLRFLPTGKMVATGAEACARASDTAASRPGDAPRPGRHPCLTGRAGHPWPAFRIPRPGRRVGDSLSIPLSRPKIKSRLRREPDLRGCNRNAEGYVKVSRVLAAGGRVKRAMDGARPTQDRMSCVGKSGPRPTGHGGPPEPARSACLRTKLSSCGRECDTHPPSRATTR